MPASEGAAPEQKLRGLNLPPQAGLANFRALSKVSEEASSLDKESSGEHASGPSGRGIVTDRDGRQGTSAVLGNIHEQVSSIHLFLPSSLSLPLFSTLGSLRQLP